MDGETSMKGSQTRVSTVRKRANALSGGEWLRRSFSIWRNLGKNGEEKKLRHPAIFTVKLVSQLLESYTSCNGEILLDPFAGSGSALMAALEKNMSAIGLDINPQFQKIFVNRATQLSLPSTWEYHLHDAHDMSKIIKSESVDICITSPPYWNVLNRRRTADGKQSSPYSKMQNDLGNMSSYSDFLSSISDIVGEIHNTLKPNGIFILNVMDLRQKSKFYPLHIDAINCALPHGFTLEDIIIWDRQDEYNNMRPLGYPYKFIINKVHEYLLIFRK